MQNRKWSEVEEDYLRVNCYRIPLSEIAIALDRTEEAIRIRRTKLKIPRVLILPGERFGRLEVERTELKGRGYTDKRATWCHCKCDCGAYCGVWAHNLIGNKTHSCGCYKRDICSERMTMYSTSHGLSRHPLYTCYYAMLARCGASCDEKSAKHYRDKGIRVCDEWLDDFGAFYSWAINHGWMDGLTIDRQDNSKGYSPDNCRWADDTVQNNNKSNNLIIFAFGERKTAKQWSRDSRCKPNYRALIGRIRQGWEPERAITQDVRKHIRGGG